MARSISRLALIWGGRFLVALSLIFVGHHLWSNRHSLAVQLASPNLCAATLLFSAIYAITGLLLAFGWWMILRSRAGSQNRIPWNTTWTIYARTQIAKYIPGNVFHLAARHLLTSREGIPNSLLVGAATLEIIMLLLASGLISLLAAGDLAGAMHRIDFRVLSISIVGGTLIGVLGVMYALKRSGIQKRFAGTRWHCLCAALLSYLLFFLVSATLFFCLIRLETGRESTGHWQLILGGYAFAWGVGFVVPGAPGGLGIREAVQVGILGGVLPENSVLMSAVLFRLVTTLGDNLFFLKGTLFGRHPVGKRADRPRARGNVGKSYSNSSSSSKERGRA